MNKRIRELMDQTGVPVSVPFDKWCEKFAELIVQECLLALEPNSMASEIDYDVEEKIYKRSAAKIQKHFDL